MEYGDKIRHHVNVGTGEVIATQETDTPGVVRTIPYDEHQISAGAKSFVAGHPARGGSQKPVKLVQDSGPKSEEYTKKVEGNKSEPKPKEEGLLGLK